MNKSAYFSSLLLLFISFNSFSQTVEDILKGRFMNRSGGFSEDRRTDEHAASSFLGPGPKTGCHGDTVSAGVTINKVEVTINGDIADIYANYSGKYTRQGWMTPCVQSPGNSGHEDRNLTGKAHFQIKQIPYSNAEFIWIGVSNLGEVSSPDHDSNISGVKAVQNAIRSGL